MCTAFVRVIKAGLGESWYPGGPTGHSRLSGWEGLGGGSRAPWRIRIPPPPLPQCLRSPASGFSSSGSSKMAQTIFEALRVSGAGRSGCSALCSSRREPAAPGSGVAGRGAEGIGTGTAAERGGARTGTAAGAEARRGWGPRA